MKTDLLHYGLSQHILRAYFNVYNQLGFGFLEKVYENAMLVELRALGISCESQKAIKVFYHEIIVGEYFADILVEDKIIIELKAAATIVEAHELQLMNYLKATTIEVGLLLNFGQKPQFIRKYHQGNIRPSSEKSA